MLKQRTDGASTHGYNENVSSFPYHGSYNSAFMLHQGSPSQQLLRLSMDNKQKSLVSTLSCEIQELYNMYESISNDVELWQLRISLSNDYLAPVAA